MMKKDIRKLLATMAEEENAFLKTRFLAPCLPGGQVRTRIAGIVQTFTVQPADFAGWGLFQPLDERRAQVMDEAGLPLIAAYFQHLTPLRLRLARPLQGQSWLTYPMNESDARQRVGFARPVALHLVTEGAAFEPVVARWDGNAWWFEESDRREDPRFAEGLRAALEQRSPPADLRLSGLTPEMRITYEMVARQTPGFEAVFAARREEPIPPHEVARSSAQETRLRRALQTGGGALHAYQDRGDYWMVDWTGRNGERHSSAIAKTDLTVISSGICLSDRDSDFDLESLVGVMERRD